MARRRWSKTVTGHYRVPPRPGDASWGILERSGGIRSMPDLAGCADSSLPHRGGIDIGSTFLDGFCRPGPRERPARIAPIRGRVRGCDPYAFCCVIYVWIMQI